MPRQLQIGVIGQGRIGRLHTDNLVARIPEAAVVAVADVLPGLAQQTAADFHVPAAYDDPQALLRDDRVEAVLICSSTDTHARLIEDAAAAGKHVFCEKPIALNLPTIDRALHTVDKAGVKLQVGFNRRFDPSFRRVHDLVASGALGRPHILRITSRDPGPPPLGYVKVSGGIFMDMTIHDFDMARFQMGCEAEEVFVAGDVLVDKAIGEAGDLDTAVTTLRFTNGAIGVIDNSRRAVYGYDQRLEVFCSEGMARAENEQADTVAWANGDGFHSGPLPNFFLQRYTASFVAELREFIAAIVDNKQTPVTGWDGRMPVVMAFAARKSYDEHRPVRLSEIAG